MKSNRTLHKIIRQIILDSLIYDAMNPECKAAATKLAAIIRINDKSDSIPHAKLEAVRNALKVNDMGKAYELMLGARRFFKQSDIEQASRKAELLMSNAKSAVEDQKADAKRIKAALTALNKIKPILEAVGNAVDVKAAAREAKKVVTLATKLKSFDPKLEPLSKQLSDGVKTGKYKRLIASLGKQLRVSEKTAEKQQKANEARARDNKIIMEKAKDADKMAKQRGLLSEKQALAIGGLLKQMKSFSNPVSEQSTAEITHPEKIKKTKSTKKTENPDVDRIKSIFPRVIEAGKKAVPELKAYLKTVYAEDASKLDTVSKMKSILSEYNALMNSNEYKAAESSLQYKYVKEASGVKRLVSSIEKIDKMIMDIFRKPENFAKKGKKPLTEQQNRDMAECRNMLDAIKVNIAEYIAYLKTTTVGERTLEGADVRFYGKGDRIINGYHQNKYEFKRCYSGIKDLSIPAVKKLASEFDQLKKKMESVVNNTEKYQKKPKKEANGEEERGNAEKKQAKKRIKESIQQESSILNEFKQYLSTTFLHDGFPDDMKTRNLINEFRKVQENDDYSLARGFIRKNRKEFPELYSLLQKERGIWTEFDRLIESEYQKYQKKGEDVPSNSDVERLEQRGFKIWRGGDRIRAYVSPAVMDRFVYGKVDRLSNSAERGLLKGFYDVVNKTWNFSGSGWGFDEGVEMIKKGAFS